MVTPAYLVGYPLRFLKIKECGFLAQVQQLHASGSSA